MESVWEVSGKFVGSAREVSGELVLEAFGSAELSASTCNTLRLEV